MTSGSPEHYFTARPATADERRTRTVHLAGREVTVEVAPGIFSPGGIDTGTAVLLDLAPLPDARARTLLDLGCGWGPIALTLALCSPTSIVYAVDVNERALDLTARNASGLGLDGVHASLAGGIPQEVRFDEIWSNPPIRIGKAALHELLRAWLPRLCEGGQAWLVVQKNLGSDSLQRWIAEELGMPCERFASSKGFRVLRVSVGHP